MALFESVLVLLIAILASNCINRLFPSVPVPIIQIALGACMALLPSGFQPVLDPDLFFVLFVAPLVFEGSLALDKQSLWVLRKPILQLAFGLVIASIVAGGYLVHFMVPAISLAAAFALVAALAPTDDVAIFTLAKRGDIPGKIMNILSGESIINDASGIVSFQFALAATLTGSFSLVQAGARFVGVSVGGVAIGLFLSMAKYSFVRWVRSLGMENVTLYILISLLTPFLIYMAADACGVSGILAVFSAGVLHSFRRKKMNPETVNLNVALDSVWAMLSFTLNGLVFLILGAQLPGILTTAESGSRSAGGLATLGYILAVSLFFVASRFAWAFFTIEKAVYDAPERPLGRWKTCTIVSLSGARGAVTLASTMSIPLFLDNGRAFPARDLIILIAMGVILCSLFVANFVLPALLGAVDEGGASTENAVRAEILHNVVRELRAQVPPGNRTALEEILRGYRDRIAALQCEGSMGFADRRAGRELEKKAMAWERQNTSDLLASGAVDARLAQRYLSILDRRLRTPIDLWKLPKRLLVRLKGSAIFGARKEGRRAIIAGFLKLKRSNDAFVLEKLRQMRETEGSPALERMISDREISLYLRDGGNGGIRRARRSEAGGERRREIASLGFQIERDCIHEMFESGRISRKTAKEMRDNISLLELQVAG